MLLEIHPIGVMSVRHVGRTHDTFVSDFSSLENKEGDENDRQVDGRNKMPEMIFAKVCVVTLMRYEA
jgi:hypothetical protein